MGEAMAQGLNWILSVPKLHPSLTCWTSGNPDRMGEQPKAVVTMTPSVVRLAWPCLASVKTSPGPQRPMGWGACPRPVCADSPG